MKTLITRLIAATNNYEVERALSLFAPDAVIDDESVGSKFEGRAGVRSYLEKFFVGYHTVSKLISIEQLGDRRAKAHLDFTGDFGHEAGVLEITVNADGLIAEVAADLD